MNTLSVVESVFFVALEKNTPEARAAYLDEACHGDANLRHCVERLLNAHPRAEGFLQSPAPGVPATVDAPPLVEKAGTIIGPYKLLQQLGEGGFGVVFLAEQEQPVRRKVALKIIKPGMDSRQVVTRFEAERQALALMDHPNIAKVLDGGTTDSGRPYFVMELVKGVPITDFCDQNRLTPQERLELFIPVCQAVQHAHQKGIIHRDLKPSNVLVTLYDDKPVPKVIDFGVAKAIEQRLTEQTLFTRVGQVIGTLEYMSPEQASLNALDVDTRSDVYALGVLLYELLTGSTPLAKDRFQGAAFLEMLRLIREEEPPRPSTRLSQSGGGLPLLAAYRKTESQKLPKLVRGELDWIAMKALEKDRARRYPTASALAADVQRYLKDETVEACPPSAAYRLRKYVRKYKAAFALVGTVAAALLLGAGLSIWQAIRARNAERAAMDERNAAMASEAQALEEGQAARAAREQLRRTLYAVSMNLIPNAWEADNVGHVLELLDDLRPRAGEEDLRGFEWYYWDRLSHAQRRTLPLNEQGQVVGLTLSADDRRAAYFVDLGNPEERGERVVKVVDVDTGREVRAWPIQRAGLISGALQITRDGSRVALLYGPARFLEPAASPSQVVVWDVAGGKDLFTFKGMLGSTMALSPDGKRLAVAIDSREKPKDPPRTGNPPGRIGPVAPPGGPSTVAVWEISDPDRQPVIIELKQSLLEMAFSPDGSRLGTICSPYGPGGSLLRGSDVIQLWDAATGAPRAELAQRERLWSLAFSPDGKRLAALGTGTGQPSNLQLRLWEGAGGDELKLLRSAPITNPSTRLGGHRLAFSPDGRRLAVWGYDLLPRILDADTGAEQQVVRSRDRVLCVAFSADGTRLVTASNRTLAGDKTDSAIQEWDLPAPPDPTPDIVPSQAQEFTVQSPDGRWRAVYSPATPFNDGQTGVSIRDRTGQEIHVFREHTKPVMTVAFSLDGRLILSRTFGGEALLWETETGKVCWTGTPQPLSPDAPPGARPGLLAELSPDGRLLAYSDANGTRIVTVDNLRELVSLGDDVVSVTFSPDSRHAISTHLTRDANGRTSNPGVFKLWDVNTGREIASLEGTVSFRGHVVFSPDGRFFTALQNPGVAIYDAATGERRSTMTVALSFGVGNTLIFSPDGKRLLAYSLGGPRAVQQSPAVFDVTSGQLLYRLEGNFNGTMAFSPDSKRIATTSFVGSRAEVKLWDAETGREVLRLTPRVAPFSNLSFSPDGGRLMLTPLGSTPGTSGVTWDATPRAEK